MLSIIELSALKRYPLTKSSFSGKVISSCFFLVILLDVSFNFSALVKFGAVYSTFNSLQLAAIVLGLSQISSCFDPFASDFYDSESSELTSSTKLHLFLSFLIY